MGVSRPPPAVEVGRWTVHAPGELRELRGSLHRELAEHSGADLLETAEIADRVALVATELAGNALRHGLPPTEIRLMMGDEFWVLDVADAELAKVPELTRADGMNPGGRGLLIAGSVSDSLGWYATDKVKHVWAAVPVRPE